MKKNHCFTIEHVAKYKCQCKAKEDNVNDIHSQRHKYDKKKKCVYKRTWQKYGAENWNCDYFALQQNVR